MKTLAIFSCIFYALSLCPAQAFSDLETPSPSQKYAYCCSLEGGNRMDGLCAVRIRIVDSNLKVLAQIDTDITNPFAPTIAWMENEDVLVIHSAKTGTAAYKISPKGTFDPIEVNDLMKARIKEIQTERAQLKS